ncbi:MAG TPA: phosphonate ABC transporter ATP-binding protein [Pseudonocardia sp.]|nr:phosphonate ABC transporter ATP-binding protein [Pseudonocardia sp.]
MSRLFTVSGLRKCYPNGTQALDGVDLAVSAGELVVLLGANGSGKSTLLRCAVRLVEPDAGTVRVGDTELTGLRGAALRRARSQVALIFQQSRLVGRRSALDNVATGALAHHPGRRTALGGLPTSERARAAQLLERVGLGELAGQRADTLSGGQAQRTAIARALAQRPSVLLADEPVASLDPDATSATMALLRDLAHRDRLAVLCVLHQPALAVEFADRVVALHRGRVVLDRSAPDVSPSDLAAAHVSAQ